MAASASDNKDLNCLIKQNNAPTTLLLMSNLNPSFTVSKISSFHFSPTEGVYGIVSFKIPLTAFYDKDLLNSLSKPNKRNLAFEVQDQFQKTNLAYFTFGDYSAPIAINAMRSTSESLYFYLDVTQEQSLEIENQINIGNETVKIVKSYKNFACSKDGNVLIK